MALMLPQVRFAVELVLLLYNTVSGVVSAKIFPEASIALIL